MIFIENVFPLKFSIFTFKLFYFISGLCCNGSSCTWNTS